MSIASYPQPKKTMPQANLQQQLQDAYNNPKLKLYGEQNDFVSNFNNPNITLRPTPQVSIPQQPAPQQFIPPIPTQQQMTQNYLQPAQQQLNEKQQLLQTKISEAQLKLQDYQSRINNYQNQLEVIDWTGVPKNTKPPEIPLPQGSEKWIWNKTNWQHKLGRKYNNIAK